MHSNRGMNKMQVETKNVLNIFTDSKIFADVRLINLEIA